MKTLWAVLTLALVLTGTGVARAQSSELSPDALKNGNYPVHAFSRQKWVQLRDGIFRQGADEDAPDFLEVRLVKLAGGDLNGDGRADAALILVSHVGGSSRFFEVAAVLNAGGRPRYAASASLGDGIKVNGIRIEAGLIVLDLVVHGDDDPSCCPTLKVTRQYRLEGSRLVKE
jgi:hypothetical protein